MNKEEISISLYREEWDEIANASIYIAERYELETNNKIPNDIKEALRKTYYTIKSQTR